MNRRLPLILILVIVTQLSCSCGNEQGKNTFVLGTDYEYQYEEAVHEINKLCEDENGNIYFLRHHYAYKYDVKSNQLLPLCGKSNCLHDKETDSSKFANCNAYIESTLEDNSGISYMDGKAYIIEENWKDDMYELYELNTDGSKRDHIYQWESILSDWILHRNTLYYAKQIVDENNQDYYSVIGVHLSGLRKKEDVIYQPPEDFKVITLSDLRAYGCYLYFTVIGYNAEDISADASTAQLVDKSYVYDITKSSVEELKCPGEEGAAIASLCFLNDKMVFMESSTESHTVYEANLDGSGIRTVLDNIPALRKIYSDGSHLYISDRSEHSYRLVYGLLDEEEQEAVPAHIEVYDKDYQLIDTFIDPPTVGLEPDIPFGFGERRYWLSYSSNEEDATYTLLAGERSQIGNLNGGEFKLDTIAEIGAAPADVSE